MSDHQHWICNHSDYQTQIFYTDDAVDPDKDHPTEWMIFDRASGDRVATGWGRTPRQAREIVEQKLAELRASKASLGE
ncbi:hypothetical protein VQH23_03980 [Pararoseomonas sp. SCSIO 73927]|uniref:hypothetical protein n=1 Tax=Pararoseomonas sp. SCSIO 73927 TaxID=3114537 RepID=UPI0030CF49E0